MARASILIVEDHPTMREAMRLVLEHEGFEINVAADGQSALSMARTDPPDLMFLAMNLPGASGADILKQLKAEPETSAIRVIVITAVGEEGRAFAMSLGAD